MNRLVKFFDEYNYTWKLDGEQVAPNPEDFEKFLDHTMKTLRDEDARLIEVGNIIVKKDDDKGKDIFDVYVRIGEMK